MMPKELKAPQVTNNRVAPNSSSLASRRPNEPFRIFMVFLFLFNMVGGMVTPGSVMVPGTASAATTAAGSSSSTAPSTTSNDDDTSSQTQAQTLAQPQNQNQNQNETKKKEKARAISDELPLSFETNQGQTSQSEVKFLARGRGYSLFFTPQGAVLNLQKISGVEDEKEKEKQEKEKQRATGQTAQVGKPAKTPAEAKGVVLKMELVGASPTARIEGAKPLAGRSNYLVGRDQTKWHSGVANWGQVAYRGVYPGIDLLYYGKQGQLEYDFVLAPGADPAAITMRFEGANKVELTPGGDLILRHGNGGGGSDKDKTEEVRQAPPFIYQELTPGGSRVRVAGGYVSRGSGSSQSQEVGFAITGSYDRTKPLIIDPVLSYSTYLGGSGSDDGPDMVVDGAGNAYLTGFSASPNFPTTPGAYSTTLVTGTLDAFVAKLSPQGDALVYSTFVGGNGADYGRDLAVDSLGQVHFTGFTSSTNFPTTAGAAQASSAGGNDAFVVKLNASGTALLYSSYLGGSGDDKAFGVALDPAGNTYLQGQTSQSDGSANNFPTTSGAYDSTPNGLDDAFVAKFNPSVSGTSSLVYATYLGGSGFDIPTDIVVDSAGQAHLTGYTESSDWPLVPTGGSALQSSYGATRMLTLPSLTRLARRCCTRPTLEVVGLSSITQPGANPLSLSYGYDAASQRVTMTTPTGTTDYTYDGAYRLKTVKDPFSTLATTYDYNQVGLRDKLTLPNNVVVTYSYDQLNRLTGLKQYKGSVPATALATYTYTLGLGGQREKVEEERDGTLATVREWSYDDAYRLSSEVRRDSGLPVVTSNYSYDLAGNRRSMSVGSTINVNYTYNELDQLTSLVSGTTSVQYGYQRGNLVQLKDNSSGAILRTYGYDGADRLVSAVVTGSTGTSTASYGYDSGGRRVKQTIGASVTNYLWDESSAYGDVVLETDGSGATQVSYMLGGSEILGQKKTSSGAPSYFLLDGQGSR